MENLRGINLYQLIVLVHGTADDEFQQWLQTIGLLHTSPLCICGKPMRYKRRSDGKQRFRCDRKNCKKDIGFLNGTIFESAQISLKETSACQIFLTRETLVRSTVTTGRTECAEQEGASIFASMSDEVGEKGCGRTTDKMDRHPNNTNNSSSSHSYSRTTGPVREYVTEYRTTLPAPRLPVSTNITTYTYGNPNGTEFQSTVTTKDFAPVVRSATYGRPPPPEFGMNSDLEFQKLSKFPNHQPVAGNTSSSSSHFSSNASANGNVAIVEVSAEGKFIVVENNHGIKDENLAGWKIKRSVDGRTPLIFHFPSSVIVRPLGKVKIWAGKGEGGGHKSAGELVFDGVDSWGVGSEMKTVLLDKEGMERATHTMSQNSH